MRKASDEIFEEADKVDLKCDDCFTLRGWNWTSSVTVSTARSLNDRFPVRSSSFRDGALGVKLMDLVELPNTVTYNGNFGVWNIT